MDVVILTEMPHIPAACKADFYSLLEDQFEVEYVQSTTATQTGDEDTEDRGTEPEFTDDEEQGCDGAG